MKWPMFCKDCWKQGSEWGAWFRVYGYGIVCKSMQPSFSERNGYQKCLRIFGVKFAWLKP
jgi:hypothetical protein